MKLTLPLSLLLSTCLAPTAPAQVRTGIDVLAASGFAALKGQRVGLITNHTGLDRTGRRTVDILAAADNVDLRVLFSPEHGFAGTLDQSEIANAKDRDTGLVIYSLYGKTRRPTPDMLKDLDTVVFDIQDIGCRFYTYISTMGEAMEACAAAGQKFVVLDRPNPIGGATAGPIRDDRRKSFVAWFPLPVRHGMTVGELAQMFRATNCPDLDLQVIRCEGWQRKQTWDRTGLRWVDPSPNMRSLKQAILYPGIGLIEGTNVSVGRGTDTPFERVGAPWLNGPALAAALNGAELPGVRFVPIEFTPSASKHKGEKCSGVYILLHDWQKFEPVRTGLELARQVRRLHPDDWDPKRWDWLLCHGATRDGILAGTEVATLAQAWQPGLRAFTEKRTPFLLYR